MKQSVQIKEYAIINVNNLFHTSSTNPLDRQNHLNPGNIVRYPLVSIIYDVVTGRYGDNKIPNDVDYFFLDTPLISEMIGERHDLFWFIKGSEQK